MLDDQEIVDILEFSIPPGWKKTMRVQGFRAVNHTASELVHFCERLEGIEGKPPANSKKGKPSQNSQTKESSTGAKSRAKSGASGNKPSDKKRASKYCPLHDTNGHDMSECKVMLAQAKKMRANFETNKSNPNYGNKRRSDNKEVNKNELNSLIADAVTKALKAKTSSDTGVDNFLVDDVALDTNLLTDDMSADSIDNN